MASGRCRCLFRFELVNFDVGFGGDASFTLALLANYRNLPVVFFSFGFPAQTKPAERKCFKSNEIELRSFNSNENSAATQHERRKNSVRTVQPSKRVIPHLKNCSKPLRNEIIAQLPWNRAKCQDAAHTKSGFRVIRF